MSEEQFGRRVAWHLDRGLDQLDQGTLNALAAARHTVLSRRPERQRNLAPAMAALGRGTVSSGAGMREVVGGFRRASSR